MAVENIWPGCSNHTANTGKPCVRAQQESAAHPQTLSHSAVPHLWEGISFSKKPAQCASKTNRDDTAERVCTALTSAPFCSAPLCCLIQMAFINADFKVRFNCIQENMHIELLQSLAWFLFSSLVYSLTHFCSCFVLLVGLWFRYNAWSSLICGDGQGFRRRSNGWRSWRWCAGEYDDFQLNRGVSATIGTETDFPDWTSFEYAVIPL